MVDSLVVSLREKQQTLATAESCTGGLLGAQITAVSGASSVYKGGVVSYCDEIKHRLLNVPQTLLDEFGAVSEQVAAKMAEGAKNALQTDFALSVTGLAGPNSDTSGKPVGLVYIGCAGKQTVVKEFHFTGTRDSIREQAAKAAWELLQSEL